MRAFVELAYQRSEDDAGVTLVATLPTIRALTIGGSASELRLPGLPPDAAVARISFAHSHFFLENVPASEGLRELPLAVNEQPLQDGLAELDDGDAITIGKYELRFHAGEPPRELLDTPLRWKLPTSSFVRPYEVAPNDASDPYIEEFMLAARPHIQAERYDDVRKLTDAELRRVTRAEEPDALERYCRFLWATRLKMARLQNDPEFAVLTQEALRLYPDDSTLLVTVGMNLLKQREWVAAQRTFEHAIAVGTFENFQSRHDARLGRIVARHFAALPQPNGGPRPAQLWAPDQWDVPVLALDSPGDELLLWRVCYHGEVFGAPDHVRYVYCGDVNEEGDVQRWEIHDVHRGLAARRVVRCPSLLEADPSLFVEIAAFREVIEKFDRDLLRHVLDRSSEARQQTAGPTIDASVAEVLSAALKRTRRSVVRIWLVRGRRPVLKLVQRPQPQDRVYTSGDLTIAGPPQDLAQLTGHTLIYVLGENCGFYLMAPQRGLLRVQRYTGWLRPVNGWIAAAALVAIASVVIALVLNFR